MAQILAIFIRQYHTYRYPGHTWRVNWILSLGRNLQGVSIGSGDGFVPSGNTPLTELWTNADRNLWRHMTSQSHSESIRSHFKAELVK